MSQDPIDQNYHDQEWGKEIRNDSQLFESLTLEGAQAGLSWLTILKKREGYRRCFAEFSPVKAATFSEGKIQALLKDPSIVRHQGKIRATVNNAQRILEIQKEFGSFSEYLWQFIGGEPRVNHWKTNDEIPVKTEESATMSEDLKKRGFSFVGPTTCYAFMQATGMVNDHEVSCAYR